MIRRFCWMGVAIYFLSTLFLVAKDFYYETVKHPVLPPGKQEINLIRYMRFEDLNGQLPRESALSARLAVWNDAWLHHGNKYWTRIPATAIGSRLFAVTLFPTSLSCDLLYSSGMYFYHKLKGNPSLIFPYWERVRKNLLGLIATPASLVSSDLVTNHFIPVGQAHRAVYPYGKLYSAHAIELYPQTVEEVQEIVREAITLNKKISIAGKLFSQGKQALPSDAQHILLHLDALNWIEIDPVQKLARCGAGITWREVQKAANESLLAVRVMQASNLFSIGGSLSINCHGWDHKSGSICQTVRSLKIVDSAGNLLTLHPGEELFHLALGGMGGFGVIVEAELSLTDNSLLKCTGEEITPHKYVDYFRTRVQQDPSIALHYYRLSLEPGQLFREGIAVNYREAGPPQRADLENEPDKGRVVDRIELQTLRRLKQLSNFAWKEEKRRALQTILATRNEVMQPPIRAILSESQLDAEWLQEFFIKPEYLSPFLDKLATILHRHQVGLFNASVRYIAANHSASFNYSPEGERFAVVLFFHQSLKPMAIAKTKEWIREVIDLLHEYGGSYYLAYQAIPTLEQFHQSYPNWQKVQQFKQKWDPNSRFDSGFFSDYLTISQTLSPQPPPYRAFFSKEAGMRQEVKDFLTHIFMQIEPDKLFALMDDILLDSSLKDVDVFPLLLSRIGETKGGYIHTLKRAMTSLHQLQDELADQVKCLLGEQSFQGYLEIGYPGRMIRPLQKRLHLSGKKIVVNTKQSLSDYLQTGIPSPVDQFVPLNDYEPISAESVASESVDLVSLFIGLHHIPEEKLSPFIRSIERVLRPGGHLILMDHDAQTEKMQSFLSLIHSIFNAGTAVSVKEELEEYRNFKPLKHWIALLEKNGLIWDGQKPLVRKGDPSLNSLIILKKPSPELLPSFTNKKKNYRAGIQTYLTGPEWQNVRSAQSYAAFIEHTPFYAFPYFQELRQFWHVYKESWKAAQRHYSLQEILKSEYLWMNTFIGVMMTCEYGVKGLISLPISWFYTQESIRERLTTHVLLEAPLCLNHPDVLLIENKGEAFHIEIPRYKKGSALLQELALSGANFLSIEGQNYIQVDLLLSENLPLPKIPGARFLYQTRVLQERPKVLAAYEMPIQILAESLRSLVSEGIEIDYIHDF